MAEETADTASPAPAVAPPATPRAPAPKASKAAAISKAVEAWWDAHVRNSPIAQHTPSYNHLRGVKAQLKAILEQEL